MDDIRIIFTASKTPFGKIIRKITRSQVSHVMIEVSVWGRRMIAEATIGGTRLVPSYKSRHHVIKEYECKIDVQKGLFEISEHFGDKYDYAGLFVIAWVKLTYSWFKYKLKTFKWKNKSIKCSELVAMFLRANNVEGANELNVELTTPDDLLNFCVKNKNIFEEIGE
jgi:hypothetical protein